MSRITMSFAAAIITLVPISWAQASPIRHHAAGQDIRAPIAMTAGIHQTRILDIPADVSSAITIASRVASIDRIAAIGGISGASAGAIATPISIHNIASEGHPSRVASIDRIAAIGGISGAGGQIATPMIVG